MLDIDIITGIFSNYKSWLFLIFALFVWITPLHLAVKVVGGNTNVLKSLGYSILSAFIHLVSILLLSFVKLGEYGIILGFLITVYYYSRKFYVNLFGAILILFFQYVFGIIVSFIINYLGIISVKEALQNIGVEI
ncbi:MAG: hypothetical protein AABW46_00945 [Nanoarchaeota archaeon]